jgi:hypothetical protein
MNNVLTVNSGISIGDICGTTVNSKLLDFVNTNVFQSDSLLKCKSILDKGQRQFFDNINKSKIKLMNSVKNIKRKLMYSDEIKRLINEQDFQYVPPKMELPILMYKPVKRLLKQGRIDGFGYNPKALDDVEDVYGRLIDNGKCNNPIEQIEEKGYFVTEHTFKLDDPDLTFEELDMIEETRKYVDYLIKNTRIDFTDYPNERG